MYVRIVAHEPGQPKEHTSPTKDKYEYEEEEEAHMSCHLKNKIARSYIIYIELNRLIK